MPVLLAIAQSGCPISTTNFPSQAVCLSGPIVKELQMNVGVGVLGPGSPANGPIGRAFQLMAINLGGAIPRRHLRRSRGCPAEGLERLKERVGLREGRSLGHVSSLPFPSAAYPRLRRSS